MSIVLNTSHETEKFIANYKYKFVKDVHNIDKTLHGDLCDKAAKLAYLMEMYARSKIGMTNSEIIKIKFLKAAFDCMKEFGERD